VSEPIHPEVRIGHAHLKVADLDRATAFYRDVLGFEVMMNMGAERPSCRLAATITTSA
jgi:catechol 2,3-dioxygenase